MSKILEASIKYLIFFTLFFTGCVSIDTTKLKSYPAKSKQCKIDVFHHKKPDKQFEEIALLRPTMGGYPNIYDLKESACLAGGDAIILKQHKHGYMLKTSATVIKYKK